MSGLMDKAKDVMKSDSSSGGDTQQNTGGAQPSGTDATVDKKVNSELSSEGVPQGADKAVDNEVNSEMKKL